MSVAESKGSRPAGRPSFPFAAKLSNGETDQMTSASSFWHKIAVTIFFIFVCGVVSHAAVVDDIAGDFKPISGYVVMSEGDEYIIDLDKTQGISTGDIFSVISPGKKIVHPVTQKVLGTLEEVKAILKVTRIKTGFSFARAVGKSRDIKRGDPIRRYSNLPTIFWDYTGEGKPVFVQLQKVLPDLKWQDYAHAQRSRPPKPVATSETRQALTFILNEDVIEVRDPEFFVLRSYDMTESLSQSAAPPSTTAKAAAAAAPVIAAVKNEKDRPCNFMPK